MASRGPPVRLFVYGTLLRGECNHRVLAGAHCVGQDRTAPLFELLDLGPYPALVTGGGTAVHGELYLVERELLHSLDAFEGVPELYFREPIELASGAAETYLMRRAQTIGARPIACGDWRRRSAAQ